MNHGLALGDLIKVKPRLRRRGFQQQGGTTGAGTCLPVSRISFFGTERFGFIAIDLNCLSSRHGSLLPTNLDTIALVNPIRALVNDVLSTPLETIIGIPRNQGIPSEPIPIVSALT